MKKIFFLFIVACLALMTSCSSTDENLRAMIPDDAAGVVVIDVPSVLSKAQMVKGDTITVPQSLVKVIDEADVTLLGDLIRFLPSSGFDCSTSCYVFFSPGVYKAVALIPLADEQKAISLIEKLTSSKVQSLSGIDFVSHLDYGYAIDDDVLLVGRFSNPVTAEAGALAASSILGKKKPSMLADDDVVKHIDKTKGDVKAYLDVKAMSSILKSNSRFSTIFGNIPALDIITDSDIKAMVASIFFNMSVKDGDSAILKTHFIFSDKGQYSKLYDSLIAHNSGDASAVLNALPGELDTYVGIKIDGDHLAAQPQMAGMFDMLENAPFTSGLNYKEILSSVKGALVLGFGKSQVSDFNFTVGAQTQDAGMIVDQVVAVAAQRGQSPMMFDGEYVYDFETQGMAMGQVPGVFYLRCVDFETGYSAMSLPVLSQNINKAAVVLYHQLKVKDNIEGFFNWALLNKAKGEGLYYTSDEKQNVVISLLKYLCWKEPNSSQDVSDNIDYGF